MLYSVKLIAGQRDRPLKGTIQSDWGMSGVPGGGLCFAYVGPVGVLQHLLGSIGSLLGSVWGTEPLNLKLFGSLEL